MRLFPLYRCSACESRYGGPLMACPRCRRKEPLVMALNTCNDCTTRFAVGLARCPHCRSKNYSEDGSMPKITVHGGPSIARDEATSPADASQPPVVSEGDRGPSSQPAEVPAALSDGEAVVAPEAVPDAVLDTVQDEDVSDEYEAMTLAELRAEAEKRDLPTYGTKAQLRDRLAEGE